MKNDRSENAIRAQIVDYLRTNGARPIKYHGGPMSEAGIPDLLVCYRGRFVYMEIKKPGEYPTKLQANRMRQLDQAGAVGAFVTCLSDAIAILNHVESLVA